MTLGVQLSKKEGCRTEIEVQLQKGVQLAPGMFF